VYVVHSVLGRHDPGWPNTLQSCVRAAAINESDATACKTIPIVPVILEDIY